MKKLQLTLLLIIVSFGFNFAQNIKSSVALEDKFSEPSSYPIDARPLLEAFDKANGIDYEKVGPPVQTNLKKAAWNFTVGSTRSWIVSDFRTGTSTPFYSIPTTCRAVGDNCYIFVADSVWGSANVNQAAIDQVKETFDLRTPADQNKGIYRTIVETFGEPPDFDKDPKIIILIFDIKDTYSVTGTGGYAVGYFHSINQYPKTTLPVDYFKNSNEAEIFFLDANPLNWTLPGGLTTGLSTIAHEFQHMIHFNYQPSSETFLNEGWSLVAEVICGYSLYSPSRYANETNMYLLEWRRNDNILVPTDYSRAARFTLYLYEQFGKEILKIYLQNRIRGISGLTLALNQLGSPRGFRDVVKDWFIANLVDDKNMNSRWGYNYQNLPKAVAKEYLNPNISTSEWLYKLGAQYFTYSKGKNLSVNIDNLNNEDIKVIAVKYSSAGAQVEEIVNPRNYSVPEFGTSISKVTLLVYHLNESAMVTTYNYMYSSSGTLETSIMELAHDDAYQESFTIGIEANTKQAVIFNGVNGAKLKSIKVALNNNASTLPGEVWSYSGSSVSPLSQKLSQPFSAVNPNNAVTWVEIPLESQNIDVTNPFVIVFQMFQQAPAGTMVLVAKKPETEFSNSIYFRPSTQTWIWYSASGGGTWLNRIRAVINFPTSIGEQVVELLPTSFTLEQNYPNPFNPSTVISYQLPTGSHVLLKVYDLLGREVATLVNEFQNAGAYNSQFSILNSQLTSGIYFYTIQAGSFIQTKKMIMMK